MYRERGYLEFDALHPQSLAHSPHKASLHPNRFLSTNSAGGPSGFRPVPDKSPLINQNFIYLYQKKKKMNPNGNHAPPGSIDDFHPSLLNLITAHIRLMITHSSAQLPFTDDWLVMQLDLCQLDEDACTAALVRCHQAVARVPTAADEGFADVETFVRRRVLEALSRLERVNNSHVGYYRLFTRDVLPCLGLSGYTYKFCQNLRYRVQFDIHRVELLLLWLHPGYRNGMVQSASIEAACAVGWQRARDLRMRLMTKLPVVDLEVQRLRGELDNPMAEQQQQGVLQQAHGSVVPNGPFAAQQLNPPPIHASLPHIVVPQPQYNQVRRGRQPAVRAPDNIPRPAVINPIGGAFRGSGVGSASRQPNTIGSIRLRGPTTTMPVRSGYQPNQSTFQSGAPLAVQTPPQAQTNPITQHGIDTSGWETTRPESQNSSSSSHSATVLTPDGGSVASDF